MTAELREAYAELRRDRREVLEGLGRLAAMRVLVVAQVDEEEASATLAQSLAWERTLRRLTREAWQYGNELGLPAEFGAAELEQLAVLAAGMMIQARSCLAHLEELADAEQLETAIGDALFGLRELERSSGRIRERQLRALGEVTAAT